MTIFEVALSTKERATSTKHEEYFMEKYQKILRDNGHKVTPQRVEIIKSLMQLDHPSAKEIYRRIKERFPSITQSTIYDTLELLVNLGAVQKVQPLSGTKYDINEKTHAHFICENCGKVRDISDHAINDKTEELLRLIDLEADKVEVSFFGRCPSCSEEKNN